jgi:hypothetical protein
MIIAADSSCFCKAVKMYRGAFATVSITTSYLAHNINFRNSQIHVFSILCNCNKNGWFQELYMENNHMRRGIPREY